MSETPVTTPAFQSPDPSTERSRHSGFDRGRDPWHTLADVQEQAETDKVWGGQFLTLVATVAKKRSCISEKEQSQ